MPVIELDMLIAFVNKSDKLHKAADKLFQRIIRGEIRNLKVASSAYLEYELILRSKGYTEFQIRSDLAAFKGIPNLGEAPLTADVLLKASELREKYNLTYFDSLHGATAILLDGEIISSDKDYENVEELKLINPLKMATSP
ncbi:MAG: type II toxin-antitoxin system VapC family toxin [archaeon GB-1867-005]|nr:type II toxin-antitoxin system VapC family toxin [Candidatus Culexmicrobium cathedralense]